jgi:hypothetical protein
VETEKRICCLCGKEFTGHGNNPWGVLNEDLSERTFKPEDRCCDECNATKVIPGRIARFCKIYPTKKDKAE